MSLVGPEKQSLDRPITTPGQLLVEGRVPEIFFRELIQFCDLTKSVEVRTFGDINKRNLQTYLEIFTAKAAFKDHVRFMGVIRDAEAKPAHAAFQSVQDALRGAGMEIPPEVGNFHGSPLSIGVFILPNCRDAGMLETLCLQAAEESEETSKTKLLPCVDDFFACLDRSGQKPGNPQKARFAGYVLARDVIDPQLGLASRQRKIPWDTPSFNLLKDFLRQLAQKEKPPIDSGSA